jgi:UDP-N-acetylglucosamine 2-epimerase (non-hydrolysing)
VILQKLLLIFGTRPEAIKMAPVVKILENSQQFKIITAITAQHRQMLDQVLELFNIYPQYDLNIMQSGQTLTDITTRVLQGLKEIMADEKPDLVLVHGDTSTTFAGSLAAFYQQIPVGHVEAGLRTYNKYSPYPEEMNRKLTGCLTDMHFAPTQTAKEALLNEGVNPASIVVTGNTVIDALFRMVKKDYHFDNPLLNAIDYQNKKVVLLTSHRRENLGEPMRHIFGAIKEIVSANRDTEVVFPVHLNPKARELAQEILGGLDRVHLIDPLDYEPFTNLMGKCYLVLTDSGGIQEEAPALGKPVLVLRETTERPEAIQAGTVKLVGTNQKEIVREANLLLSDPSEYAKLANAVNPYGDGKAAARILQAILQYFSLSNEAVDEFRA